MKLAEQFKNHLINTENTRKDVEVRLLNNEAGLHEVHTELYKAIGDSQKAFENRLIQEKHNTELMVDTRISSI